MADSIVQIDNLSHFFKRQKAIDNISITIPKGSIFGFLGPNGAGKTTTLRLLLGLLKNQSGKISLFGKNIHDERVSILKRVGSLIEQPSLYVHLSGRDNLKVFGLSYRVPQSRISELLNLVGLSDSGNKKVRSYSLGMKQRLSIAVALLNDPVFLVLDEPTNGLDPQGIIEMRKLIRKLNEEYGKTILISSHLLSEVEKVVTDIAIINSGKILFQGPLGGLYNLKNKNSVLEIEVNDSGRAIQVLDGQVPVRHVNGSLLVDFVSPKETARINALLVDSGIEVYKLAVNTKNLENLFIQVISE